MCSVSTLHRYVSKGLASIVEGRHTTIRLSFSPRGLGNAAEPWLIAPKANACVGCGAQQARDASGGAAGVEAGGVPQASSTPLIRWSVVPHAFRRRLPERFKARDSHDVVLLCTGCHSKLERPYMEWRRQVFDAAAIAEDTARCEAEPEVAAVRSAARALQKQHRMPPERRAELSRLVARHSGADEATAEVIERAAKLRQVAHAPRKSHTHRASLTHRASFTHRAGLTHRASLTHPIVSSFVTLYLFPADHRCASPNPTSSYTRPREGYTPPEDLLIAKLADAGGAAGRGAAKEALGAALGGAATGASLVAPGVADGGADRFANGDQSESCAESVAGDDSTHSNLDPLDGCVSGALFDFVVSWRQLFVEVSLILRSFSRPPFVTPNRPRLSHTPRFPSPPPPHLSHTSSF